MAMEDTNLYQQRDKCIEEAMNSKYKYSFCHSRVNGNPDNMDCRVKHDNDIQSGFEAMIKREEGFSLVELLITMVVFVLILTATSNTFIDLLKDFKKQSALSETNIEGAVGLETLKRDIASAGYGLPWNVTGVASWAVLANYNEATANTYNDGSPASALPTPANTTRAPRAIVSGNNSGVDFSGVAVVGESSDYLVIKAVNVATNVTSQKWTHLKAGNAKTEWTPLCENVNRDTSCNTDNTVRVIVSNPGGTNTNQRALVVNAVGVFFAQYDNPAGSTSTFAPAAGSTDVYVLYGVSPDTNLRMPFNRADYYIQRPASISPTCAPNTGVLYKGVVSHTNGTIPSVNNHPILDCVADMQVVFRRDTGTDGIIDTASEDISTLDAATIRDQIKEVRVYILAHEGQRDTGYTYSSSEFGPGSTLIRVGDPSLDGVSVGRTFDLVGNLNYRWKIYTLVIKMENLK
ncbi:MAG: prepilin-type N-terminal cleavage/methylation domain-containing protein [Nitrospirae bacterium]|nr:MAG: prepilin-type N-terminal cleavage/methylation domain-containing protein [Nitrospirota bacterium]